MGAEVSAQWPGRAEEGGSSGASRAPEKPARCPEQDRLPGQGAVAWPRTSHPLPRVSRLAGTGEPSRKGRGLEEAGGREGGLLDKGGFLQGPAPPSLLLSQPSGDSRPAGQELTPASETLRLILHRDFCPPGPGSLCSRLRPR